MIDSTYQIDGTLTVRARVQVKAATFTEAAAKAEKGEYSILGTFSGSEKFEADDLTIRYIRQECLPLPEGTACEV